MEEVVINPLEREVGGEHYKMSVQPVTFITFNKLSFIEGNVIKYLCRHRKKGGKEDILKAIHYLELLLKLEYPEKPIDPQLGQI